MNASKFPTGKLTLENLQNYFSKDTVKRNPNGLGFLRYREDGKVFFFPDHGMPEGNESQKVPVRFTRQNFLDKLGQKKWMVVCCGHDLPHITAGEMGKIHENQHQHALTLDIESQLGPDITGDITLPAVFDDGTKNLLDLVYFENSPCFFFEKEDVCKTIVENLKSMLIKNGSSVFLVSEDSNMLESTFKNAGFEVQKKNEEVESGRCEGILKATGLDQMFLHHVNRENSDLIQAIYVGK